MSDVIAVVIIVLLVINLLGLIAVGIRIGGQSSETKQLNTRLTQLEAQVKYMPTHQDLANLRAEINKLAETTATISGQTRTMTDMLRTIQEHLLENDR